MKIYRNIDGARSSSQSRIDPITARIFKPLFPWEPKAGGVIAVFSKFLHGFFAGLVPKRFEAEGNIEISSGFVRVALRVFMFQVLGRERTYAKMGTA